MAAIDKQIEATRKRIAKYEKNTQMYSDRADKQITGLQNKGYVVSKDDFQVAKTGNWKYDYEVIVSENVKQSVPFQSYYSIVDNLVRWQENKDRCLNERKHLDGLLEQQLEKQKTKQSREAELAPMVGVLQASLEPFRQKWVGEQIKWHTAFYQRIHRLLPEAKKKYHSLGDEIFELNRQNCFRYPTAQIRELEEKRKMYGRIISARPASYPTQKDYLAKIKGELDNDFTTSIGVLAEKCRDYQLDLDKLQVLHPRMEERGIGLYVKDGDARIIDARMIWAAENSEYVSPHTRYLVTERKNKNLSNIKNTEMMKEELTVGMSDWKFLVYNIPLDVKNNRDAKIAIFDSEDAARIRFSEFNQKGVDRFILLAKVSPNVTEQIQNQKDIEDVVELIKKNRVEHKVLLCNKDKETVLGLGEDKTEKMTDSLVDRIDWVAYRKEVEQGIRNERLWCMGGGLDAGLHEENMRELLEELDYITNGQYQEVIKKYDNYMGDANEYFKGFYKSEKKENARITDINIYSGKNGEMFVRCKIDGQQQMAEKLDRKDVMDFDDNTDRVALAEKYFKDVLQNECNVQNGLKR